MGHLPVSLRDYLAAAATDTDVDWWLPSEMGQAKELADKLCIDTSSWLEAYSRLRCWARYRHADAMIAERERKPT